MQRDYWGRTAEQQQADALEGIEYELRQQNNPLSLRNQLNYLNEPRQQRVVRHRQPTAPEPSGEPWIAGLIGAGIMAAIIIGAFVIKSALNQSSRP